MGLPVNEGEERATSAPDLDCSGQRRPSHCLANVPCYGHDVVSDAATRQLSGAVGLLSHAFPFHASHDFSQGWHWRFSMDVTSSCWTATLLEGDDAFSNGDVEEFQCVAFVKRRLMRLSPSLG